MALQCSILKKKCYNIFLVVEVFFVMRRYEVEESNGTVKVCLTLEGILERNVLIMLSTRDGTAFGKCLHYLTTKL